VTTERAVLFDFDGTLADSAPDLAAALNWMRVKRGLQPLPPEAVRAYSSMGARGLLRVGFGLAPEDPDYKPMRAEFLDRYEAHICVDTRLFKGIPELLAELEARGMAWGIATNKASRFTDRLVPRLLAQFRVEPDCVVCGDSTAHLKPHPAMLLLAAQRLELRPEDCMYLGDDLRDIQAARAAGMRAIAVEWGYHGAADDGPATWNADARITRPEDLIPLLAAR
jgi:phosphoglycolate phosphatase